MIWPPHEAAASTAAAKYDSYPERFISGIVNVPVVTTLAEVLPLTALIEGAGYYGRSCRPPRVLPAMAAAKSLKKFETPVAERNAPNVTNRNIRR